MQYLTILQLTTSFLHQAESKTLSQPDMNTSISAILLMALIVLWKINQRDNKDLKIRLTKTEDNCEKINTKFINYVNEDHRILHETVHQNTELMREVNVSVKEMRISNEKSVQLTQRLLDKMEQHDTYKTIINNEPPNS